MDLLGAGKWGKCSLEFGVWVGEGLRDREGVGDSGDTEFKVKESRLCLACLRFW